SACVKGIPVSANARSNHLKIAKPDAARSCSGSCIAVVSGKNRLDIATIELREHALTCGWKRHALFNERRHQVTDLLAHVCVRFRSRSCELVREMGLRELAKHRALDDDALQLTHIAGPRVVLEARQKIGREWLKILRS